MNKLRMLQVAAGVLLAIANCTLQAQSILDDATSIEDWWLGAQPTAEDIEALAAAGVTHVISTRSSAEMAALPFDEPALVASHGMTYVHIPIDRDAAWYSPARVDALAEILDRDDVRPYLHCRSGYRASVLTAAYLIRERGDSLDDLRERLEREVEDAEVDAALGLR